MAIFIEGLEGNTLIAPEEFLTNFNGKIIFSGKGASVTIGENCHCNEISFTVGQDCSIVIGQGCWLAILAIFTVRSSNVAIGRGSAFTWQTQIDCHESHNVTIGNDCMIASGTFITVSDMHSIIDVATGARINPGADVVIGDHVWLGGHSSVMKGVTIGSGSIVGMGAVVNKDVPPECAVAGVPAKVIRTGVTWNRDLLPIAEPARETPIPSRTWLHRATSFFRPMLRRAG